MRTCRRPARTRDASPRGGRVGRRAPGRGPARPSTSPPATGCEDCPIGRWTGRPAAPAGTTSACYRTRQALLTALVRPLVALDRAELQEAGEHAPRPRDARELVAALGAFAERRLTGDGQRSPARYACAIESVRHPGPREILLPRDNAAGQAVRAFPAAQGVTDPKDAPPLCRPAWTVRCSTGW
ncbi:hypothetical protein [Streptomyces sp. enrichment culture]|uniref:hypothetical protein n=1 Tax=Streptomyces sp. enrichment culture TaxID=1795815 RepID=UPI003F5583B4